MTITRQGRVKCPQRMRDVVAEIKKAFWEAGAGNLANAAAVDAMRAVP
jgi:hypothetical protein